MRPQLSCHLRLNVVFGHIKKPKTINFQVIMGSHLCGPLVLLLLVATTSGLNTTKGSLNTTTGSLNTTTGSLNTTTASQNTMTTSQNTTTENQNTSPHCTDTHPQCYLVHREKLFCTTPTAKKMCKRSCGKCAEKFKGLIQTFGLEEAGFVSIYKYHRLEAVQKSYVRGGGGRTIW